MSEDRYADIRSLPFDTVAGILGIDISRFRLRKGGTEYAGPCPVHKPKRNATSFSYSQDGKWNCFSCSAKGRGGIDLAMAVCRVGFQEAVALLTPYAGQAALAQAQKEARKPEIRQVQELPTENEAKTFQYEKFYQPSEWLQKRNLAPETLKRYGVGLYDNPARQSAYKGKILLRIQRWSDGAVVGYLCRDPRPEQERGDAPKYLLPPGLHKGLELWGAWQLKEDGKLPLRIVYLVESPFAVMAFWQKGLPAVSPFGWSLSEQQVAIIGQLARGVVCLPDKDKEEAFQPYAHALSRVVWVRCPPLPEGVTDPERLTLEQIKALTTS